MGFLLYEIKDFENNYKGQHKVQAYKLLNIVTKIMQNGCVASVRKKSTMLSKSSLFNYGLLYLLMKFCFMKVHQAVRFYI